MSLRTKFSLLLGVLGLTVALCLGTALAFGVFLERELTRPFQARTLALTQLSALHSEITAQALFLPGGSESEDFQTSAQAYNARCQDVDSALDAVSRSGPIATMVGAGAIRNLCERVIEARASALNWFADGSPEAGRAAALAHAQLREFIERTERRVIQDAGAALGYGQELRRMHQWVLAAGIAGSLLAAMLAAALFTRWVLRPVGELRRATNQIAAGDYTGAVPVRSQDELGRLAAEVNRMARMVAAAQADAIERERLSAIGSLIGRLAHNLRNPLAAIRSLAELTCRRAAQNEQIRRDQTEIVAAVDRFNEWLTELVRVGAPLELSRVPTNQRDWWQHVLASQRPLARMRSVQVVAEMECQPPVIDIDPRRLEHAMVILLTNAIQASPPDGIITIATHWDPSTGWWEAQISDQGPGVPDELKEKVFLPYFTSKPDGNGIGLAIARQVAMAHGGAITVSDNPGGGAVFSVRLPLGERAT